MILIRQFCVFNLLVTLILDLALDFVVGDRHYQCFGLVSDRSRSKLIGFGRNCHLCIQFNVNFKECLMTRIQKISLDYHFKVGQEADSTAYAFFGFNGTARIWRISALDEAGGWKDRTTVEDMEGSNNC